MRVAFIFSSVKGGGLIGACLKLVSASSAGTFSPWGGDPALEIFLLYKSSSGIPSSVHSAYKHNNRIRC